MAGAAGGPAQKAAPVPCAAAIRGAADGRPGAAAGHEAAATQRSAAAPPVRYDAVCGPPRGRYDLLRGSARGHYHRCMGRWHSLHAG